MSTVSPFSATAQVKSLAGTSTVPGITFTGDTDTGLFSPAANQVAIATGGVQRLLIGADGSITPAGSLLFPLGSATAPSVSFTGDTNTGIYSPGADQVSIATNGTERLRIDATGQIEAVSLGTAADPTYSFTGDPNTGIYSPGADQVAVATNGAGRLFVDASGNVKIDTGALRLRGDNNSISADQASATRLSFTVNSVAALDIQRISTSGAQLRVAQFSTGSTAAGQPVFTNIDDTNTGIFFPDSSDTVGITTGGNERLRITSVGLVGIGTSSPGSVLDLGSGTQGRAISWHTTSTAAQGAIWTNFSSADLILGRNLIGSTSSNAFLSSNSNNVGKAAVQLTAGSFVVYTDPASTVTYGTAFTPTPRFTINSSGNVGIGTTSPIALLNTYQASGGSEAPVIFQNFSTTSGTSIALYLSPSGGNLTPGNIRAAAIKGIADSSNIVNLAFFTNSSGADPVERARIDSSGRLLVGTSTLRAVEPNGGSTSGATLTTHFEGISSVPASVGIIHNGTTAAEGSALYLARTRGTAVASSTLVALGDTLGTIAFAGGDGTDIRTKAAEIYAVVDGTPGANDMPGRLVFSVTADGASSPTEAMRINNARAIGFNGANFGTAGQALVSNGSAAPPTWQSITPTTVFGWNHTNDNYGLYLPGTSIRSGDLSGTVDIDVQSRLRRCVINDAGVVQYYLDADDSTLKAGDWLRIVETESLTTAYTGTTTEATNSLLRVGVPAWAAGTFTRGQRVTHNGFVWECVVASTTATPAAGTVASDLTGTDGQVVVEVPAFSVRYGFANGVHTREVRLGCSDSLIAQGFQPHPAFIRTDGTYKSAFYLGAYHAYSDGTNLASVSGQTNTRSLTRATFRSRAALRGTGWHIHSYLEHAAVQTLLVTEYRDHNSQKVVGRGSQEGSVYGVGTGLSNVRGNRSGNAYTVGGANTDYVSYRGIENLWGRAWQWVDGFNVYERVVYLTNNQTAFADDTSVGYRFYTQVPSGSASYQKEIFPLPDVFLPSVVSGASDTTYLGDAFWISTGWRVAYVGGSSFDGTRVGAFTLSLDGASSVAGTDVGARLCLAVN